MTNKKLISTLLVILLIFNLTLNISAISSDNNYIEDYNDSYSSNVINRLNDIKNQRINEHKIEEPAPEDYDQSVIDYINNNPVEDSADVSVQSELNEQEIILPQSSMNVSALSESGLLPDELKIEPVNSPFNLQANAEESVDLTTGSLTYKKTLLSLPGRNGLNLDISVKYNSIDAVISKNEFDDSSNIRVDNGNNFAIGWSFGFPQIKGNKNRYGLGQDKNLVLPDGSAFKIDNDYENLTEDLLLSLQNYKLNDLYFIRKADTKEYILTCEDGKKYYFDGTYGNITKMEDRFGNSISFEYEEIDFYRGTFFDFLYNPTT